MITLTDREQKTLQHLVEKKALRFVDKFDNISNPTYEDMEKCIQSLQNACDSEFSWGVNFSNILIYIQENRTLYSYTNRIE